MSYCECCGRSLSPDEEKLCDGCEKEVYYWSRQVMEELEKIERSKVDKKSPLARARQKCICS